jgi:hypothetical protein
VSMHLERLVASPVFILSSIRSGSTLLRCILNTHSLVHAPHELHLTDVRVTLSSRYAELSTCTSGLSIPDLEYLLWDHMLYQSLTKSGKVVIVDKTPGYSLQWHRLREAWPEAKFLFLLRDPGDVLASACAASPGRDPNDTEFIVSSMIDGVDQARRELPGCEVRFEDLISEPTQTVGRVCGFLGVNFEPTMLEYSVPSVLCPGIGDFTDKIRSGQIQTRQQANRVDSTAMLERRKRWCYE